MNVLKMTVFLFALALLLTTESTYADLCDQDGDGHAPIICGGDDCDDNDANRYPGNVEVCDAEGHDEDCNFSTFGDLDQDGDGFVSALCANELPDGQLNRGDDCNDQARSTHPIATETCDGFDNNCNGAVDEGVALTLYEDWDLDGHGNSSAPMAQLCAGAAGYSNLHNDCDDTNPAIEPGSIVCSSDTEYSYCNSDGKMETGLTCAADSVCVAQNNGTGVCIPGKTKGGKGRNQS